MQNHDQYKNPPRLSLEKYIHLIANYSECSEAALVVTTIYLDRIGTKNPDYKICEENVHKLFATAFRLANKFCDDDHFSNKRLVRTFGITLNDLNQMEIKFINDINHELFVDLPEYEEYRKLLS